MTNHLTFKKLWASKRLGAGLFALGLLVLSACSDERAHAAPSKAVQSPQSKPLAPSSALSGELRQIKRTQADQQTEIQSMKREVGNMQDRLEKLESSKEPQGPERPPSLRPDSAAVYSVPIDGAPSRGSKNALVTIVRSSEYACPYTERSNSTMEQLLQEYPGQLKVVYKPFIVHRGKASEPAIAACAATRQGRFSAMDKALWSEVFEPKNYDPVHVKKVARRAGLKMRRYERDRARCQESIAQSQKDLSAVGIRGTPSFSVNGRFLSGTRPIEQFRTLIDEELTKAKHAIEASPKLSRHNYYAKRIVRDGIKELTKP